MITQKVKNFIDKYKLSGTFIVAFSGGYDSMCLLDILYNLGYNPIAIHLNHNWRGKESLDEEKKCEEFCLKRNIQFYSETLPDNVNKNETSARNARYEFFYKCAQKYNSKIVFTAHNYNDNAETVLYRIIKGTGTAGLQGIEENRDIFYRPLLSSTREEIEAYCKKQKLNPNNDSSNENIKYKRNLIRKKIIPLMKEINPNVIKAVNSLSEIAKEDFQNKNTDKYNIRQLLIENNIDYDRKKIEDIQDFINKNKDSKTGKTYSLTNNLWLFVNKTEIDIITKPIKSETTVHIDKEGEFKFDNFVFSIKEYKKKPSKYPSDNQYKAYINIDKIDFTLRHRLDGDFIQPLGIKGTQKLKKYLNEKKIPQHLKDNLITLCKANEVLWVAGIGLSDKIKVTDKPTHIIELRGKNE